MEPKFAPVQLHGTRFCMRYALGPPRLAFRSVQYPSVPDKRCARWGCDVDGVPVIGPVQGRCKHDRGGVCAVHSQCPLCMFDVHLAYLSCPLPNQPL